MILFAHRQANHRASGLRGGWGRRPGALLAAGLAAVIWAAAALGCAGGPRPALPTVAAVDLERYMGVWYEAALIPNRFQAVCAGDTQARYALEEGRVRVENRCRRENGEVVTARGVAETVPGSGNAKLRVSFFRPFYGDYWILALDPDYRWALVGVESREYAWILGRSPQLEEETVERLLVRAEQLGFDRAAFRRTPHARPIE